MRFLPRPCTQGRGLGSGDGRVNLRTAHFAIRCPLTLPSPLSTGERVLSAPPVGWVYSPTSLRGAREHGGRVHPPYKIIWRDKFGFSAPCLIHASSALTTFPCTSVNRKSRP